MPNDVRRTTTMMAVLTVVAVLAGCGAAAPRTTVAPRTTDATTSSEDASTAAQEDTVRTIAPVDTDGTHRFAIADGALEIADDTGVVSRVDLRDGQPRRLVVVDGRVLVAGQATVETVAKPSTRLRPGVPDGVRPARRTRIWTVAVGDPSAPRVVSTTTVDGTVVAGPVVDGTVHLVTRSTVGPPRPIDPRADRVDAAVGTVSSQAQVRRVALAPRAVAPAPGGLSVLTIVSLDPAAETLRPRSTVVGLGAAPVVAATHGALYIAATSLSGAAGAGSSAPATTGDAAAPTSATSLPVTTHIRMFGFEPGGVVRPLAAGSLPGRVSNRAALSPGDDGVRVVITADDGTTATHLLVVEGDTLVEAEQGAG